MGKRPELCGTGHRAVVAFKPAIVYFFRFRGGGGTISNVEEFEILVDKDASIEMKLRNGD